MPSPFQFFRKVLRTLGATSKRLKIVCVLAVFLLPIAAYGTVSTVTNQSVGQGNNVTVLWNYAFPMTNASFARVYVTNVNVTPNTITQLSTTQYSIAGVSSPSGGTVTYPLSGTPLAPGYYLTIQRVVPLIQTTSISNQGPTFRAIENALDYLTYITQQLQTQISVLQAQVAGGSGTVPVFTGRIVSTGVSDNAFVTDTTIAWASATSGAKSEILYTCDTSNAWKPLVVTDQSGTFGTYPLTITPFSGAETINGAASYIMPFNRQSASLLCDGAGKWMAQ